jgi:hypothetical protein
MLDEQSGRGAPIDDMNSGQASSIADGERLAGMSVPAALGSANHPIAVGPTTATALWVNDDVTIN